MFHPQLKTVIGTCIEAGVVPFIQSSPGVGKSAIVRQVAKEYNLVLIDHRMSTSDPTDMNGLPSFKDGKATFSPFDIFPTEDTPIPEGKQGWLLFLDEMNSAPRSVVAAAYKLILDRMVGQHKLHSRAYIVAAGNLDTDNAIVNNLGTAMMSRLVHLRLDLNPDEWMINVGAANKYDQRILAYLAMNPHHLMQFNSDKDTETFACPRTWEFTNRLLNADPSLAENTEVLEGVLGKAVSFPFAQFCRVYKEIPDLSQVTKHGNSSIPVPGSLPIKWAVVSSLAQSADKNNIETIIDYLVKGFDKSMQILFLRMVSGINPTVLTNAKLITVLKDVAKYVHSA